MHMVSTSKIRTQSRIEVTNSDNDVLQLVVNNNGYELVEIYVEHLIDVPIIDEGLAKGRGKDFVLR